MVTFKNKNPNYTPNIRTDSVIVCIIRCRTGWKIYDVRIFCLRVIIAANLFENELKNKLVDRTELSD